MLHCCIRWHLQVSTGHYIKDEPLRQLETTSRSLKWVMREIWTSKRRTWPDFVTCQYDALNMWRKCWVQSNSDMDEDLEWFAPFGKMWSFSNILLHSQALRLLKSITIYRCAALVGSLQTMKQFSSLGLSDGKILIQILRRSTERKSTQIQLPDTHQPTTLVQTPPVSRPRNIRTSGVLGTDMKTTDLNQNLEVEKIDLFRDNLLHS